MEPNISPWRRAVCGDLTSAFNFANPNNEPFPELPGHQPGRRHRRQPDLLPKPKPPAVAAMPKQEMGIRPARALPYELGVHALPPQRRRRAEPDLRQHRQGRRGVPGVRPARQREPAETLHRWRAQALSTTASRATPAATTTWKCTVRTVSSGSSAANLAARPGGAHRRRCRKCGSTTSRCSANLRVQLINRGRHPVKLTVKDNVYRQGERRTVNVPPGQRRKSAIRCAAAATGTTSASAREADSFLRRFSGRMEDGRSGFSDPAWAWARWTF